MWHIIGSHNVFRGFRKFRFITVLMVWNDRVNSVKYVSV